MKFISTAPLLLSLLAPTSTNAFAPIHTTTATNGAVVKSNSNVNVMPLQMVASQEVEVNKRKKTKEVCSFYTMYMSRYIIIIITVFIIIIIFSKSFFFKSAFLLYLGTSPISIERITSTRNRSLHPPCGSGST